jgi:hypothetical protein
MIRFDIPFTMMPNRNTFSAKEDDTPRVNANPISKRPPME